MLNEDQARAPAGQMPPQLVTQLRFTRDEFVRGLTGLTDEEARRRFQPINWISWMIGHVAWQEQRNRLTRARRTRPSERSSTRRRREG